MAKEMFLRIELLRSKLDDIEDSVSLVDVNLPQDFDEFSMNSSHQLSDSWKEMVAIKRRN